MVEISWDRAFLKGKKTKKKLTTEVFPADLKADACENCAAYVYIVRAEIFGLLCDIILNEELEDLAADVCIAR